MAAPLSDWSGVLPFSMHEVQRRFFRDLGEERLALRLYLWVFGHLCG